MRLFKKSLLVETVSKFLDGLSERTYSPRDWTMQNATPDAHVNAWREVMIEFGERFAFKDLASLA